MTLAIIGASGRNNLSYKLENYEKMVEYAGNFIQINNITHLISGGSSLSDHVAVKLFITGQVKRLTLYLPCEFDLDSVQFENRVEGRRLNQLHNIFSTIIQRHSRYELKEAILRGAEIVIKRGFKNRNTYIAKSPLLLAFLTEGDVPKSGGTFDTWNKCSGQKVGIDIYSL